MSFVQWLEHTSCLYFMNFHQTMQLCCTICYEVLSMSKVAFSAISKVDADWFGYKAIATFRAHNLTSKINKHGSKHWIRQIDLNTKLNYWKYKLDNLDPKQVESPWSIWEFPGFGWSLNDPSKFDAVECCIKYGRQHVWECEFQKKHLSHQGMGMSKHRQT